MAVEFVTYKKEKLPVVVDYYVLMMLQKEHGTDLAALDGNLEVYQPMLYYALQRGFKLQGKESPYKLEDMTDILGECFFELVAILPNFFPDDLGKLMAGGGQKKKGR